MPDNLKDLIEKSRNSNGRVLNRSEIRQNNQRTWEFSLRRRVKKGLVYGGLISVLALGIYGGNHCWDEYKSYISAQNKKMVYYQKEFNQVKHFYNQKKYVESDELSEKLQKELDDEWFFSPADDFYDKVKEYDDKFIDPEVKRIKREMLKKKIRQIPYKLREKWDNSTPEEKLGVYVCGLILFAIICKLLSRKKKD